MKLVRAHKECRLGLGMTGQKNLRRVQINWKVKKVQKEEPVVGNRNLTVDIRNSHCDVVDKSLV